MVFKIYPFGYRSESFSKRNDNADKIIQNAKCKRIATLIMSFLPFEFLYYNYDDLINAGHPWQVDRRNEEMPGEVKINTQKHPLEKSQKNLRS